jgi:hypothetical protein
MTWLNLQDFESDDKYLKDKGLGIEGLNINCTRLKTQVSQNFNLPNNKKM